MKPSLLHKFCIAACLAACFLCLPAAYSSNPVHVVEAGDTLGAIADRHSVTVKQLQALNSISNPNRLKIGQKIKLPPKDKAYTVVSGDVLSKIARDHQVTVAQIIAYNELGNPDALQVGQVLKIPLTETTYRPKPVLPAKVRRSMASIRVNRSKWQYIVIHHSASERGSTAGMDRYHREERRMENGLAYHFVIGNGRGMLDGQIDIGNRWKRQIQGGHLASSSLNQKAIGICLVGNFDKRKPSKKQLERLEALVRYLMKDCGVAARNVRTHTQINPKPTRCPGKHFPTSTFKVSISS